MTAVGSIPRISISVCLFLLSGSSYAQTASGECPPSVPRVYVDAEGQITLDGKAMNAFQLEDTLAALSPSPKKACYSHGLLKGNPVPGGLSAMRALVSLEWEILLYTDATFKTPLAE